MSGKEKDPFPVLPLSELHACLTEINLAVTVQELTHPEPEKTREWYNLFMESLAQDEDDLSQPHFAAVSQLEHPQLHEESLKEITWIRSLNRLMRAAGLDDFSVLQDVYHPVARRTIRNLSALVNFLKYRQEKIEYFGQLHANVLALQQSTEQLEIETQTQLDEIRELNAQIATEEPQIRELQEHNKALEAEILKYNQQQARYQAQVHSLKENDAQIAKQHQDVKYELAKARQESNKLQGQVVKSPEELRKSIKSMADALKTERAMIGEAKSKISELQGRFDTLGKIEKHLGKAIDSLKEMSELLSKTQEYKAQAKEAKSLKATEQQRIRELETKISHLTRQIKATQEKTARLTAEFEVKAAEVGEALATAKKSRAEAEQESRETGTKIDQNQIGIGELTAKLVELRRSNLNQRALIQQNFEKMEATVLSFHQDYTTALSVKN